MLNAAIRKKFSDMEGELRWTAPLEADGFKEPRDQDFLTAIGCEDLAGELAKFWPPGGPVWDGLAVLARPGKRDGVVLVEAPEVGLTKIGYITRDTGFPVDPSVKTGEAPWSFRVEVRARSILDELLRAPDLDELSVKRNLRKSIRQQSHIQLSPTEYEVAVEALERAVDLGKGDLRQPSLTVRI